MQALHDHDATALVSLRDMALQGDFKAMAALALLTRLNEQDRKLEIVVPGRFWEDWLYRLVGEQEGGYTLGIVARELTPVADRTNQALFDAIVTEALRRAAKAGHAEAMFGLTLYARLVPDPHFRMPDTLSFPIAEEAMLDTPFSPEKFYWLGKAAASGSSRASQIMGWAYLQPMKLSLRNTRIGITLLKQSVAQGNAISASELSEYLNPAEESMALPEASCYQFMYYYLLNERMTTDDAGSLPQTASEVVYAEHRKHCLSERDDETLLKESGMEYTTIRAKLEAKNRALTALYQRAAARLPELQAAYEKAVQQSENGTLNAEAANRSAQPGNGRSGSEQCSLYCGEAL